MVQVNFMINTATVSSNLQTEQKASSKDENKKFGDVLEQKRTGLDDKKKIFKEEKREKIEKTNKTEKTDEIIKENQNIQDEDANQTDNIEKTLNKQEVHKQRDKEDGKEDVDSNEEIKEMEIRKKIMALAKELGIEPGEAAKLIMPGDLVNIQDYQEKIGELTEKLTALVNVNEQNKAEVSENIKEIIEQIFTQAEGAKNPFGIEKKQFDTQNIKELLEINKEDAASETENGTTNAESLKDINKKEISNSQDSKINKDEESVNSEITNTDKKQDTNKKQDTIKNEEITSENKIETKDEKGKTKSQNEDGTSERDAKSGGWEEKIKVMFKYQDKADNSFKLSTENSIQTVQNLQDIPSNQNDQLKTSSFVIPRKEEVLSQIIDKAAVTLTPDKAEMVINLKPDNLGKLEMKIVTEKGILNAQIVAENQQVKQIIETNFNILKDALEKQGIAVQSFSVSVGNNGLNRRFQNNEWKSQNSSNQRQYKSNGITVVGSTYLQEDSLKNKLMWPDSTVNYTA
ncbi:MAG: flagellar hook-length control protein FliK [Ignavibacteriales bacterium]